jgi:NAD(P)-dependent dehydrogenase (short-subunit alcohol dehydrogenase family)
VAVVTGAARGIGRAAAVAMAREGADIAGIDICAVVDPRSGVVPATPDDLRETGRQIEASGRRWVSITCDQRDLLALRDAAARAVEELGGIDILFANAGTQAFQPLLEMDDAHWRVHIDVNLTGTANAIRAFAPHIIERARGGAGRGGRIIVTTSTQGRHGTLHGAAYSASKWGIIGLMKSAALDSSIRRSRGISHVMRKRSLPRASNHPDRRRTRRPPARFSSPRHRWVCLGSSRRTSHRSSFFSHPTRHA